jgi:hypothetical protein
MYWDMKTGRIKQISSLIVLLLPLLGLSCPKAKPGTAGQAAFPIDVINENVKQFITDTYIWINRGPSIVRIAGSEAPLFIRDYEKRGCFPIDVCLREYPFDIHSYQFDAFMVDSPENIFRLIFRFEENKEEIHGDFHGEMSGMVLTINLVLTAENDMLTFGPQSSASFDIKDIDLHFFPDDIVRFFYDYLAEMRTKINKTVNAQLLNPVVRQRISTEINAKILPLLALAGAPNALVRGVAVKDSRLVIDYVMPEEKGA